LFATLRVRNLAPLQQLAHRLNKIKTRVFGKASRFNPSQQVGTRGLKAELTLVAGYAPRWFTCPQTVTHPGSNRLIATRLGVEPATSRS